MLKDIDVHHWFIIEKITDILFTEKYNEFCKNTARSILDFLINVRFITGKQVDLLLKLRPINISRIN